MKTMAAVLLSVAVLAVGCGGGLKSRRKASGTGPADLTVINHSAEAIQYLFMTPAEQTELGPDKLGQGNPIAVDGNYTVPNVEPGDWNIRVEDASQNFKEWTGETFEAGGSYELEVTADGWARPE
jgi:hypothetical protein